MSEPQSQAIDSHQLEASYGNNQEFLVSLVQTALAEVQSLLPRVSQELEAQNNREVLRLAHTIKGSAKAVFATGLRDAAKQVEEHAREGNMDAVQKSLPVLFAEANRFGKAASEF